jgi:hypothetical protein
MVIPAADYFKASNGNSALYPLLEKLDPNTLQQINVVKQTASAEMFCSCAIMYLVDMFCSLNPYTHYGLPTSTKFNVIFNTFAEFLRFKDILTNYAKPQNLTYTRVNQHQFLLNAQKSVYAKYSPTKSSILGIAVIGGVITVDCRGDLDVYNEALERLKSRFAHNPVGVGMCRLIRNHAFAPDRAAWKGL